MTRKVLLVDDSKTVREIIKIFLMGSDIQFLEADNGKRGLQLARIFPDLDLIIVDVQMPEMDGVTFVREFRATQRAGARRVPVVMLTGQTEEEFKTRALEAGADEFLLKPAKAEVVRALYARFTKPSG